MTSVGEGRVLVVDDEPLNVDLLVQGLSARRYEVSTATSGTAALRLAAEVDPDVVLLDIMMPGMSGIEVCRHLRDASATANIPIIFTTALSDLEHKVAAFEAGGVDYLVKPFRIEEVLARVGTHVALRRGRRELEQRNRELQAEIDAHARSRATVEHLVEEIRTAQPSSEFIGDSPALDAVRKKIDLVAPTDALVLILGETGTGKELVARAIHERSPRRDRPLVKLNCAALPRDLVESELFGHEPGAFTGALKKRQGRFEQADGGTLFLDEIGELPVDSQVKLLRVLQEQEFELVGGSTTLRCDVRVIAATNRDLAHEIEAGRFRADLFYRLNVVPIHVPALRERPDDLPQLAAHFLTRIARRLGREFDAVSPGFLASAAAYDWPGNVRELEHLIERCAVLGTGRVLEFDNSLPAAPAATGSPRDVAPARTLAEVERAHIRQVLGVTGWVIEGERGAARLLGLNPSTLRGRLRKHGIGKPR